MLKQRGLSWEKSDLFSKRKPNLFETNDEKEFVNEVFTDLLNKTNVKKHSRYTCLGAVFKKTF